MADARALALGDKRNEGPSINLAPRESKGEAQGSWLAIEQPMAWTKSQTDATKHARGRYCGGLRRHEGLSSIDRVQRRLGMNEILEDVNKCKSEGYERRIILSRVDSPQAY